MNDLTAFLVARLADDEAYARNAFGDHNDAGPDWHEQWSGALNIGDAEDLVNTNDSQVSRFMERFDPARILREVEAKRLVIAEYESVVESADLSNDADRALVSSLRGAVKALALPYSDHEDYREEWRP